MLGLISDRVLKLGDNIDTDLIYPGKYLSLIDPEEIVKHVLEGLGEDFPSLVKPGDIIVAGRNFGCGSSREQAATSLRYAGVAALVGASFHREAHGAGCGIFFPTSSTRLAGHHPRGRIDSSCEEDFECRMNERINFGEHSAYGGGTLAEKILAREAGKERVTPGEVVEISPDRVMSASATTALVIRYFKELGARQIWDPSKVILFLDHEVPAESVASANAHKIVREFVKEFGIRTFYDVGEGISHQVMIEKGHVLPGQVVLGKDSHSTSYGVVGALGVPIVATEMAYIWATGRIWLRVPESFKVVIHERLQLLELTILILRPELFEAGQSIQMCD